MHFAVEAGDVETVLAVGPEAAREAARAGSHRQALAHLESVRPHLQRLGERERAAVLDDYGWELYNAHRFREAVDAGRAAAALYERLDDPVAVAHCLVRVSRHLFMAGETVEAEECADRAVTILEPTGDTAALASASLHRGAILALTDEPERAAGMLELARDLALRAGRGDLAALALNYLGVAARRARRPRRPAAGARQRRGRARRAATTRSPPAATATSPSCSTARGGWPSSRRASPRACRSPASAGSGRTPTTSSCTAACCCCAAATSTAALAGLRELVHGVEDPGMLFAYSVPWLGRALARRGDPAAGGLLAGDLGRRAAPAAAARRRVRGPGLGGVGVAGRAAGDRRARRGLARAAARPPRRRAVPRRAGRATSRAPASPAEPFDGCPEPWAAGLRGDWRAAADGWAAAGDPYEQALELTESGDARHGRRGPADPRRHGRRRRGRARARAAARRRDARGARPAGDHARQPGWASPSASWTCSSCSARA